MDIFSTCSVVPPMWAADLHGTVNLTPALSCKREGEL